MSLRRQISFTTAIRDMRGDRTPVLPGFSAARAMVSAASRSRNLVLVTSTGAYDRAAIMRAAHAAARAHQTRTGEPWATCMSVALKAAWFAAKLARPARTH